MKIEDGLGRLLHGLALLVATLICSVVTGGCAAYPERYECAGLGSTYWRERCLRWPGSYEWDLSDPCCLYLAQFYAPKGL